MVETINPGIINSEALRANFGHAFDDGCPAVPYPYAQPPTRNLSSREARRVLFRKLRIPSELSAWQDRERARALSRLAEFFQTAPGTQPIQVFKRGETFKLSDFSKGTVIRYESDSVEKDLKEEDLSRFAIIAQAKTNVGGYVDCLVRAPTERVPSAEEPLAGVPPNLYMQSLVVGEVFHRRYAGSSAAADYERVFRYKLIEVWQLGNAVREQVGAVHSRPKKQR